MFFFAFRGFSAANSSSRSYAGSVPVRFCFIQLRLDTLGSLCSQRGTSLRQKQFSTVLCLALPVIRSKEKDTQSGVLFLRLGAAQPPIAPHGAMRVRFPSAFVSYSFASIHSARSTRNAGHRFAKNSYQLFCALLSP